MDVGPVEADRKRRAGVYGCPLNHHDGRHCGGRLRAHAECPVGATHRLLAGAPWGRLEGGVLHIRVDHQRVPIRAFRSHPGPDFA